MLQENHRIGIAHRGRQQANHVDRRRRRHDLEARHVHEHRVEALGVLRALAPGLADHAAHDHRHLDLAAVHVVRLGRHVDDLVHAQHQEVHPDVHMDRAHAGHRGREVRRRKHDHAALDVLGIQVADQLGGRDLALVLVTMVAGHGKQRRALAVLDAGDRDGDVAIGRAVHRERQFEPAHLLAVGFEIDLAADAGFAAAHAAIRRRVQRRHVV